MSETEQAQLATRAGLFHDSSQVPSTSMSEAARSDDIKHAAVEDPAISRSSTAEVCVHEMHPPWSVEALFAPRPCVELEPEGFGRVAAGPSSSLAPGETGRAHPSLFVPLNLRQTEWRPATFGDDAPFRLSVVVLQAITSPAPCAEGMPGVHMAAPGSGAPAAGMPSTAHVVRVQEAEMSLSRQPRSTPQQSHPFDPFRTCAAAPGKAATAAAGPAATDAEEAAASSATRSVVVELPEIEPDLCSICLDPFTVEDPANSTQCA